MQPLALSDPRQAGEFRLSARLGLGGMGQVFLGYSPAGRAVAVKICHPELAADPAFVERFSREVTAAQAVNGPYTAQVVAAGPYDKPPWMATVYVPGPSLSDFVQDYGPLPEPAAWRLAAGIAEALLAVHACGLVHRDLKPSNVLLAVDGPRVIDFGIASALEMTGLTAAGSVMGSPPYMSPEQATGVPVGPASDVFALASTLAFAASGAPPFGDGDAPALLFRVAHMAPALDSVPERLRGVVAACLAKDPAGRPTLPQLLRACQDGVAAGGNSAASFWPSQMTAAIARYQTGPASVTPPNGAVPSGRTFPSGGAFLSGGQLLAGSQGLSGGHFGPHPPTTAAPSDRSSQLSPSGRAGGVLGRRRALFGLGGLVVAGGLAAAGWELAGPRRNAAAAGTTAGGTTGTAASGSVAWRFEADGPVSTGAEISSDGTTVYIGTDKGTVYALDATTGHRRGAAFQAGGSVSGLAMAGNTLLVGSADGKVHAFPTETSGGALEANWTSTTIGTAISGAPTYTHFAVAYAASDDGYVSALDVNTGRQKWRTLTGKGAVVSQASGIGVVWVGSQDGTIYVINTDSGKVTHTYPVKGAVNSAPLSVLGSAYFGTSKGVLYALEFDSIAGPPVSLSWNFKANGAIAGTPVASGDAFFTATTSGTVYQVQSGSDITNQPGTALWSSPVGPLHTGPTFDNNMLYVGSDDGSLYALDPAQQGKVSWTHKTGGAIKGQVLAKNNLLYFGNLDHQVYAVHE